MSSPVVLVDLFGDIVTRVSTVATPKLKGTQIAPGILPNIVNVNYLYGVPMAVNKKLTEWSTTETFAPKNFPFIALIQPFDEVSGGEVGYAETSNVRFVIGGLSFQEWDTATRYANNFKPVLYVILDEFLKQMFLDARLELPDADNIPYTKRDWPFWDDGKDKNPFNFILDVIEINFKSLKINLTHC
jgi:hypothetical protein